MGEIADAMLSGMLDMETGEYLGDECGYPRTAADMEHNDRPVPQRRTRAQKRAATRRRARARRASA